MGELAALPPSRCYQGIVPSAIATCAADGTPNVTYLSQVFYIDAEHVALSCQFFNKTKRNVLENPFALVQLNDPVTFEAYQLSLRYEREETEGPLFDAMAARIQAIASHTGMEGVFRLLSSDVYKVLACTPVPAFLLPVPRTASTVPAPPMTGPRTELRGLQAMAQATGQVSDLSQLLGTTLETLEDAFGFEHAMILLSEGEASGALRLVASHGYATHPPGALVQPGEGLIGTVAAERRLLRFGGLPEQLRYGRAVRSSAQQSAAGANLGPERPLPGLPDSQSHMAMPLLSAERLVGVLAVESRAPAAFDEWDEAFLEIVAGQVAVALDNALLRERASARPGVPVPAETCPEPSPDCELEPDLSPLHVRFFANDDCVFVDGEYLVRNVPGKILWKLLSAFAESGRTEFSNRELRLDPWLGLPPVRDNLESRLSLLRKRLEQRCPHLRLEPIGRGRFRLCVTRALTLEEVAST